VRPAIACGARNAQVANFFHSVLRIEHEPVVHPCRHGDQRRTATQNSHFNGSAAAPPFVASLNARPVASPNADASA